MPPILLVNGATTTVNAYRSNPAIGKLISPRAGNDIQKVAVSGMSWGADNDALAGIDPDGYIAMLNKIEATDQSHLLFVSVPDAVEQTPDGPRGDWTGTRWLWRAWLPALRRRGLPAALVVQDGATPDEVPWGAISALFIGGSTAWKLSSAVCCLCDAARRRGIWIHVGRVNSLRRLDIVQRLGAQSFDGGQFSRFPATYIPRYLARLGQLDMMDMFHAESNNTQSPPPPDPFGPEPCGCHLRIGTICPTCAAAQQAVIAAGPVLDVPKQEKKRQRRPAHD